MPNLDDGGYENIPPGRGTTMVFRVFASSYLCHELVLPNFVLGLASFKVGVRRAKRSAAAFESQLVILGGT